MSNTVKEVTLTARGKRMVKKTKQELNAIVSSGSLSAAAAQFELTRRVTKTEIKGA